MTRARRQISVTLPARLWATLAARARAQGVTVEELIHAAVRSDLASARRRRRSRP